VVVGEGRVPEMLPLVIVAVVVVVGATYPVVVVIVIVMVMMVHSPMMCQTVMRAPERKEFSTHSHI